jgi:hypothetical protein
MIILCNVYFQFFVFLKDKERNSLLQVLFDLKNASIDFLRRFLRNTFVSYPAYFTAVLRFSYVFPFSFRLEA